MPTRLSAQADNDAFAHAESLPTLGGELHAYTHGATLEALEPALPQLAYGSVWFRWIAPRDGDLKLSNNQSAFIPARIVVFQGSSLESLVQLTPDVSDAGRFYPVVQGQSYSIAIGAEAPEEARLSEETVFHSELVPLPSNDRLENAAVLSGTSVDWGVDAAGGTVDPREEQAVLATHSEAPRRLLWYRWTSPSDGIVELSTLSIGPIDMFAFRGVRFPLGPALTNSIPFLGSLTGPVRQGEILNIAVTSIPGTLRSFGLKLIRSFGFEGIGPQLSLSQPGSIELKPMGIDGLDQIFGYGVRLDDRSFFLSNQVGAVTTPWLGPGLHRISATIEGTNFQRLFTLYPEVLVNVGFPNDAFARRLKLIGAPIDFDMDLALATMEPGEPPRSGGGTAWWRWTAPYSGRLVVTSVESGGQAVFERFKGSSLSTLVKAADDLVVAGEEYALRFSMDGPSVAGRFHLDVWPVVQLHSQFANRKPVPSTPFFERVSTDNLSAEAGDPSGEGSLWYTFVAQGEGALTTGLVDSLGGSARTNLFSRAQVFTGDSRTNLTPVQVLDTQNTFHVMPGVTYQIQIGPLGNFPWAHPYFYCLFTPAPANDRYANALRLEGDHLRFGAVLGGSSIESGEPPDSFYTTSIQPFCSVWYRWRAPVSGLLTLSPNTHRILRDEQGNPARYGAAASVDCFEVAGEGLANLTAVARVAVDPEAFACEVRLGQEYAIRVYASSRDLGLFDNPIPIELHVSNLEVRVPESQRVAGLAQAPIAELVVDPPLEAGTQVWVRKLLASGAALPIDGGAFKMSSLNKTNFQTPTLSFSTAALGAGIHWLSVQASNRSGYLGFSHPVRLELHPGNDDFLSALLLVGDKVLTNTVIEGATAEADEPVIGGSKDKLSTWFRWTAPNSGQASFYASIAYLRAYTGTSLDSLVPTSETDFANDLSYAIFACEKGVTYFVQCYQTRSQLPGSVVRLELSSTPAKLTWEPDQFSRSLVQGQSLDLEFGVPPTGSAVRRAWLQMGDQRGEAPIQPPFRASIPAIRPGNFLVRAFAELESGQVLTNAPIAVDVAPSNSVPQNAIRLTAPAGFLPADLQFTSRGTKRVWYRYEPPADGVLLMYTTNVLALPFPALYVEPDPSPAAALPLATNPAFSSRYVGWAVKAHQVYWLALTPGRTAGPNDVSYSLVNKPSNDFVTTPDRLTGTRFEVEALAALATLDKNEPQPDPGITSTLWWEWTSPDSGVLLLESRSLFQAQQLFRVASDGSLVRVMPSSAYQLGLHLPYDPQLPLGVRLRVEKNATYRIMAGGFGGVSVIRWAGTLHPFPPNDQFANAQWLRGRKTTWSGSLFAASLEPGELTQERDQTLWWRWLSPDAGTLELRGNAGAEPLLLELFEGASMPRAELLARGTNWTTHHVEKGHEYHIRISNGSIPPNDPDFTAQMSLEVPGGNDQFSSATVLTGERLTIAGWNSGATRELGEPLHGAEFGGRSVWYQWTAPHDGETTVRVTFDDARALLGIYRGSSMESLGVVTQDHGDSEALATFVAVAGQSYSIAVDSGVGTWGDFTLGVEMSNAAAASLSVIRGEADQLILRVQRPDIHGARLEVSEDLDHWAAAETAEFSIHQDYADFVFGLSENGQRFFRISEVW